MSAFVAMQRIYYGDCKNLQSEHVLLQCVESSSFRAATQCNAIQNSTFFILCTFVALGLVATCLPIAP